MLPLLVAGVLDGGYAGNYGNSRSVMGSSEMKITKKTKGLNIEDVHEAPRFNNSMVSLLNAYPEASLSWYYEKNCGWGPEDFSTGSGIKAWFKCSEGPDHVFRTEIKRWVRGQRTSTLGCPYCRGTYVSVTNWLKNYPDIAAELVVGKDGKTAEQIVAHSPKRRQWQCHACGYSWEASPGDRLAGHGCKVCNVGAGTDLRDFPKALKMFDRKNNPGIDPHRLPNNIPIAWKCSKGADHKFSGRFNKAHYPNSPACTLCNLRIASSTNNLSLDQFLLSEFHPKKNSTLRPEDVPLNSKEPVWWLCLKNKEHEWQSRPRSRTEKGQGCPFCSGNRLSREKTLAVVAPAIALEFCLHKNAPLTPDTVSALSKHLVTWRCLYCSKYWQQKVFIRIKDNPACPHCQKRSDSPVADRAPAAKVLRDDLSSLKSTHPELSEQWHSEKNGTALPEHYSAGSVENVWWQCPAGFDHVWKGPINRRTKSSTKHMGCPFCSGKKVCRGNSLLQCFPAVAALFHQTKNPGVKVEDLTYGSGQIIWWQCSRVDAHLWPEKVNNITSSRRLCPFCAREAEEINRCR
jgi:hypothetical protein